MRNAKKELIEHIESRIVDYVLIRKGYGYGLDEVTIFEGKLEKVLPLLDFEYDDGYGGQVLFGYIWYSDGTWSERGEYDGSEWWDYKSCPSIETAKKELINE